MNQIITAGIIKSQSTKKVSAKKPRARREKITTFQFGFLFFMS